MANVRKGTPKLFKPPSTFINFLIPNSLSPFFLDAFTNATVTMFCMSKRHQVSIHHGVYSIR